MFVCIYLSMYGKGGGGYAEIRFIQNCISQMNIINRVTNRNVWSSPLHTPQRLSSEVK